MRCSVIQRNNGRLEHGEENPSNKNSDTNGEGDAAIAIMEKEINSLEGSIQKLFVSGSGNGKKASELIAKLEVERLQSADEKRRVRRAAWITETQEEMAKLVQGRDNNVSKIFSEPVWNRILEQVEDSKDKAMLSNMSMTWRDALKEERTTFLFHEVFPLLNRKGYLSIENILMCRRVCCEWKKSIEYWKQLPIKITPLSLLEVYQVRVPEHSNFERLPYDFPADWTIVSKFLQWSKRNYLSSGNPFLSRRLRIGGLFPRDSKANSLFWAQIKRLLDQWGREVWSLEFVFPNPHTLDSAEIYKLVCKLLRLTPNLRFISFTSPVFMEDTDMLKDCIEKLPLPELSHLDTFSASYIPPAMLKSMLNKFGSSLNHVFTYGMHPNQPALGGIRLPNLKKFHLMSLRFFSPEEFKFPVDWPSIEELDLHFENFLPDGFPYLFQAINDFGKTLRRLHLKLEHDLGEPVERGAITSKKLMLELPNLEYFSLAMAFAKGVNLKTIDFILPMVSLKDLTLCYVKSTRMFESGCPEKMGLKNKGRKHGVGKPSNSSTKAKAVSAADEGSGEIIKFWNYAGQLYDSNIWRLLQELRTVTIISVKKLHYMDEDEKKVNQSRNIAEKIYTREGYRKHVRLNDRNGAVVAGVMAH